MDEHDCGHRQFCASRLLSVRIASLQLVHAFFDPIQALEDEWIVPGQDQLRRGREVPDALKRGVHSRKVMQRGKWTVLFEIRVVVRGIRREYRLASCRLSSNNLHPGRMPSNQANRDPGRISRSPSTN